MSVIGNIIWIVFGGWLLGLEYLISGILLCCTLIGIPFGIQVFKICLLAFLPFGKTSVSVPEKSGCLATVMNILWILIGGIWIALTHLI